MLARDFWIDGRGWDWMRVGDKLSHTILMRLASTVLKTIDLDTNKVGWLLSDEGVFSVGSTYNLNV